MQRTALCGVLTVLMAVAVARPGYAQDRVTLDVLGTAAVEAGMSGSKPEPVTSTTNGRRVVFLPKFLGGGSVYAYKRGDGTTVVELVGDGEPAPADPRATKIGAFRRGDTLTLNPATLELTGGTQTPPAAPATGQARISIGFRVGIGTGSLLGAVKENCDEIRTDTGASCTGSDRGATPTFGFDLRSSINRQIDFGARFDFTRPSDVSLNFSGMASGIDYTGSGFARGSLLNFAGEFGVRPRPRIRCHFGAGLTKFKYTTGSTLTAFGQTDAFEQENSGIGPRLYLGVEYNIRPNISIYGEAGRSWLKDSTPSLDDEDFDEQFSAWIIGLHFPIIALRLWR